ncbi:MAG TPA: cation transporter, partial [Burkholderiales bacterium]|nr:cation transporter [Burkholderiales bacterium]
KACAIEALKERQSSTLRIVLAINVVMFFVELASGLWARSTALLADSLDNLGDAATYGLSLYVVGRGPRAKAKVALFKAALILSAAVFVFSQVIYAVVHPGVPVFEMMGIVSLIALAANGTCLALLWKHRSEDVNMSSVWECSRNDIASNMAVFIAAGAVWITDSGWPDIAVGLALAALFLRSVVRVTRDALHVMRTLESPAIIRVPGKEILNARKRLIRPLSA